MTTTATTSVLYNTFTSPVLQSQSSGTGNPVYWPFTDYHQCIIVNMLLQGLNAPKHCDEKFLQGTNCCPYGEDESRK